MVKKPAESILRTVDTPAGPIDYELTRKKMVSLRLRVSAKGVVKASVPFECTDERADRMVLEHVDWILKLQRAAEQNIKKELLPEPDSKQCREILYAAMIRMHPLVAPFGVDIPELKLRRMKSQWGNCHWKQGYITLNTVLARCPEHLQDYVALHELVHFLHQNHGRGFCTVMDRLMPDWKKRRKELYDYSFALDP